MSAGLSAVSAHKKPLGAEKECGRRSEGGMDPRASLFFLGHATPGQSSVNAYLLKSIPLGRDIFFFFNLEMS